MNNTTNTFTIPNNNNSSSNNFSTAILTHLAEEDVVDRCTGVGGGLVGQVERAGWGING
jgi:hypothetical protein